ncbi:hypothetical protein BGZ63DRAFT_384115 [Mariannaea sp. PMI_226]|nr:hypothetical protein BGZ63DRAFT_384115 [Mariannaea sp. PMI_226]
MLPIRYPTCLALLYAPKPGLALDRILHSSLITHPHPHLSSKSKIHIHIPYPHAKPRAHTRTSIPTYLSNLSAKTQS